VEKDFDQALSNVIIDEMSKKMQPLKKWLSWLCLALVGFFFLVYTGYHLAYFQKVYPGVNILGQPVGNKKVTQVILFLENYLSNQNSPEFLSLFADGQQWPLVLSEINFKYQLAPTAQRAYQIGRSKHPWTDFQTKIKIWFAGQNLSLSYELDQKILEEKINALAGQVFIPAIEPTIKINSAKDGPRVLIEQGKDGQEVDKRKLLGLINQQLAWADFKSLEVPIIKVSPLLTGEQIEQTKSRAEKLLGKKIVLDTTDNHWELGESDLLSFLSFTNGFDQDKIASWSANLAGVVNRLPQNAALQFTDGRVTEFRPAKDGQTLNQTKTVDLIAQSLKKLEEGEKEIAVNLPVNITPPNVKTAEVNNLGIKELVGRGVSYFQGSIANRIHNIQLASSRLNGLLIPPGETFSFNSKLGEVSQSTGYKEAYIIKSGRTILGDGGGVCQTSTTLFRAALDAGLPIVERKAHAYRVSYYEQHSSVGLDATVFDPTADLKITNDTPGHLLLQTNVDLKNQKLTYDLYGTSDGRKATIGQVRIWDQTPPLPDLYQDDPTLPAGTIKQVDWKAPGAKTSFDYYVERQGEVLQNRTFYSNYRAWQAVFLKGTGPQI
jgi:vancomycin resistance protein YoaR